MRAADSKNLLRRRRGWSARAGRGAIGRRTRAGRRARRDAPAGRRAGRPPAGPGPGRTRRSARGRRSGDGDIRGKSGRLHGRRRRIARDDLARPHGRRRRRDRRGGGRPSLPVVQNRHDTAHGDLDHPVVDVHRSLGGARHGEPCPHDLHPHLARVDDERRTAAAGRHLARDLPVIEDDVDSVLVVSADEHQGARLDPQRGFADGEARRAAGRHQAHRIARAQAERRATENEGQGGGGSEQAGPANPQLPPGHATARRQVHRAIELREHAALDA